MIKRGLASSAGVAALLVSRAVAAQPQFTGQADTPQWLQDRRYNEGIGIRTGDLEIHPGVAGEVGYDSNWFLRSDKQGADNGPHGPADVSTPPIPAAAFRITPSLYLSTLGPQRRSGDVVAEPPSVAFRAGVNATYRAFVGLGSDASQPQNDVSKQDNIGGAADARLDILPARPFGANLFASYARVMMPNYAQADPNQSFNRDDVGVGGELVAQPGGGGGTLDWRFGYQFHDVIFENTAGAPYDNLTHEAFTRGRWKFRPRTALIYDATLRFISYADPTRALTAGLVSSTPVRTRIGLNGLITDRFSAMALVGWGAGFYANTVAAAPQYDSVIGQAELKWFLAASPGVASVSDVGLALSSIALGYTRDFANSYIGNYYGSDRGYLKFSYFFAGRALVTLEGGVGAVEYPNIFWGNLGQMRDGQLRHSAFTDIRADATLFSEYRFTETFGLNATVRYTANFSNAQVSDQEEGPGFFDMSWTRLEAYLGVRWFM
jgi:hypothetical protein